VCITVCGWIWSTSDFVQTWQPVKSLVPDTEWISLQWESAELQNLGRNLVNTFSSSVALKVVQYYIMRTVLAATVSALSTPLAVLQATTVIGNPWSVVAERAKKCGKLLAAALMSGVHGHRPVTLVGFSHGARLIFHCLEELAAQNATGIVESSFLLGACITTDCNRWRAVRSVVSGRLVNGFSTNDWVLSTFHRMAKTTLNIAGLEPVACFGVENVDLTSVIPGHLLYRKYLQKALLHCKFGSTTPLYECLYTDKP
jgi:hypothetical protein